MGRLSCAIPGSHVTCVALACFALVALGPSPLRAQAPHDTAYRAPAAFDVPAWAFPVVVPGTKVPSVPNDSVTLQHVPGSDAAFTQLRARERFDVVDWHPDTHRPAPAIVTHGRRPSVMACGFCHLPDGMGRPENAMIAGLREDYIVRQVEEMKSHARGSASPVPFPPTVAMRLIADSLSRAELVEAAKYFARVRAREMTRVIETDSVPRTIASNGLYVKSPEGGVETLGRRIIEFPVELNRHELRDSRAEYVANVPRGSVARGRALARGDVLPGVRGCQSCHGGELRGTRGAPPIAGRFPSYLLRQLLGFRSGARATPTSAPMQAVAKALTLDDMIAAAAYAGTLKP
ncbi:MAG: cytochrome C [Gemmatimonadaceae bacterium]